MKDSELRTVVLEYFYARRHDGSFMSLDSRNGIAGLAPNVIFSICEQLADHGLILWKPIRSFAGTSGGMGKITAHGVDVVDGNAQAGVSIMIDSRKTISVRGSTNVQIGDHNVITIVSEVQKIIEAINALDGSPADKQEARGRLKSFLSHPLVTGLIGASATGFIRSLSDSE